MRCQISGHLIMNKFRSIFISDIHLGTPHCKAKQLIKFLEENSSENLYLVGDIIDTWNLGKHWYWDDDQERIIQEIWKRSETTNTYLLSGNHDETNIPLLMNTFSYLEVLESCNFYTARGEKFLVVHGHQFDTSLLRASSDFHFSLAMMLNNWYYAPGIIKSFIGKLAVKFTTTRDTKFRGNIIRCVGTDYSGVICGHLHKPTVEVLEGDLSYFNTGDWVSHCTAITEDFEGVLCLRHYLK